MLLRLGCQCRAAGRRDRICTARHQTLGIALATTGAAGTARSRRLVVHRDTDNLRAMYGRYSRWALRVLALVAVLVTALTFFASGAFAASGTINSVSIVTAPWGGMSMSATVTVNQADCPTYGTCDWGLDETAAPVSTGCTTFESNQMHGESGLLTGTGTFDETLPMSVAPVGTDQVCLFIDGPTSPGNVGSMTLLASTTLVVPAPSGSISVASENDGQLGGFVSMSEPGCGDQCSWSVDVTEQDGTAPCPTTQSGTPIWSSGTVTGSLKTLPYAFTPDISTDSLHVCLYNQAGLLLESAGYSFPAASTSSPRPTPDLSVAAGRAALRRALLRRSNGARQIVMTCRSIARTTVKCLVTFQRARYRWTGSGTADLASTVIRTRWVLQRKTRVRR